ncbi:jg6483 [Pararge aegeria aegeria]|uniref:Jg6483 protein n=1 Tax=Pararge aegeria aegeria TaxID=348720 RepID=A0A8S4SCS8_9NEOP|nr:jg6483 [Pararge aegeria aegeria]
MPEYQTMSRLLDLDLAAFWFRIRNSKNGILGVCSEYPENPIEGEAGRGGWCSWGGGHGAVRGAGGAPVRAAGAMRARVLLALAALCAASAAARELRVLQADARTAFYIAIAAPPSAADVVRAFNRTLSDVSKTYLAGDSPLYLRNITLLPLYIELPEDERLRRPLTSMAASEKSWQAMVFFCEQVTLQKEAAERLREDDVESQPIRRRRIGCRRLAHERCLPP